MDYRTERDSLGTVNVPRDALWGAETQRALENFPISGLAQYRAFVWSMAVIKRAAAEVNRDLGLLAPTLAEAIITSAQEVMDNKWADQFVVDPIQAGAGTSHHMNVNEVIANRANQLLGYRLDDPAKPVNPHDHVNMAQSTNDTIPTAIRLGCLWRLEELLRTLDTLKQALEEKSHEFDDVIKSGRTHLQDAVPVRLGQEFGAYAQAIAFDRERIATAGERLRRLGIGGTATGTGLNAHSQFHARMLERINQLTGVQVRSSGNLFESIQSLADPLDFSAALNTLANTLTRIANDLRLLASGPTTGLDEIRLPAVQPGSSIMPGKVNPVMAEMLNMACYQVMGNHFTVMLAASAGQLELNVMMPIVAYNLFQTMDIMIHAHETFTMKCVAGITANRENAAAWLARSTVLVTALNPIIGYEKAVQVAQEAMARRVPIRQVVLEKRYLTAEQLDHILDLAAMTEGGILNKRL